jgi:hypothetical protein
LTNATGAQRKNAGLWSGTRRHTAANPARVEENERSEREQEESDMKSYDFCESTTDPAESLVWELVLDADAMHGTPTIHVVVVPVAAYDVPTDTEWSAFMGMP